MFQSSCFGGLLLCLFTISLCGCNNYDFAEVPVQPVTGKLLVNGEPAYGAFVVFHPSESAGMTKGNKPFARVKEDGTFEITTYTSNDGVPVGQFKVTVIWPEDPEARGPSPDRLKGRYETPEKSRLEVQINKDTAQLPEWDLN